jgi:hypothetical protein
MKSHLNWFVCLFIVLLILLCIKYKETYAQHDDGGGRTKPVEISYIAYTWQLLDNSNNHLLCKIVIDHDGFPTEAETIIACPDLIYPQNPTPGLISPTKTVQPGKKTPTPEPTSTIVPTPSPVEYADLLQTKHWVLLSSWTIYRTEKIPIPEIYVTIDGPSGPVDQPYITISAVEPVPGYEITGIHGLLGDIPFECPVAVCDLEFNRDSQITYWATSSFGDESKKISITGRISQDSKGYYVSISNLMPITQYSDSCSKKWGSKLDSPIANWAILPQSPADLYTQANLHLLAGQLINHGIVNAKACPGNGLINVGIPNACGIDAVRPTMISWQNQFDPAIWEASRQLEIPAWLIKSVIELESQFWPANTRYSFVEYGLGQVNLYGAESALHWDPDLGAMVCSDLVYDCNRNYISLDPQTKLTFQGGLIRMLNAECPNCPYGIDLDLANQSISPLARIIRSQCNQTAHILSTQKKTMDYDDLWRLSMVGYHSGYQCQDYAVKNITERNEPLDWSHLASYLEEDCPGSVAYVDNLFNLIYTNSQLPRQKRPAVPIPHYKAIVQKKPPSNPHPLVNGVLKVIVYIDYDQNNKIDEDEMIDRLKVEVTFADQTTISDFTANGEVTIKYINQAVGSQVRVALPLVYQEMSFNIPADEITTLIFHLVPPNLPSDLP